ncbi:hypothetical protein [Parasedimentitalea maritima]|uniref:Uncharacterized protein n=1 Tax=Parasedimentitalea maritima TaxID=2578117 RepID=A0A6A4RIF4_9RHOB|nr:hypothetical protein [Zongyanglinia marina]KAE9630951.1 hypothetical protein GP644_06945 [Zongyanglinia marina]
MTIKLIAAASLVLNLSVCSANAGGPQSPRIEPEVFQPQRESKNQVFILLALLLLVALAINSGGSAGAALPVVPPI